MNLKENWLASFEKLECKNDILKDKRAKSIAVLAQKGFPTTKDEAWKYTSLEQLLSLNFSLEIQKNKSISLEQIYKHLIDLTHHHIVFVDGIFRADLSDVKEHGVELISMVDLLVSDSKGILANFFDKETRKDDVFTAFNTAFTNEGMCVKIADNKIVEKPLEVLYLTTDTKTEVCIQPRNLMIVGNNAQVKVIENHKSLSSKSVLVNMVTEIFIGENAVLDAYKVQNDGYNISLIDNTYISQQPSSNASVHTFCFGGFLTRNNLNFYHHGQNLESTLKGATILSEKQHADHYTLVNHANPNCQSHQDYKTILLGESSAVFNGKIMVEKIAQKTNAYQQNDTVLLSDKAKMNTKPQLEIFADDVKCSHGCTIGELNTQAMFYLRARGIPEKQAQILLTHAFVNTIVESTKIESLKAFIEKIITEKLK